MKKLLATLLVISAACASFAQSRPAANTSQPLTRVVTGIVYDELGQPIAGASVRINGTQSGSTTSPTGGYKLTVPRKRTILDGTFLGYNTQSITLPDGKRDTTINFTLSPATQMLQDVVVVGYATQPKRAITGSVSTIAAAEMSHSRKSKQMAPPAPRFNTEDYSGIQENIFHQVKKQPLSTFSSDVDRASYSNVRRFLNQGMMPPIDAVRTEELINYFDYKYTPPTTADPVAIHTDMAICPWNSDNRLVRIGIQGKIVDVKALPASNIVFLLDVSGSMSDQNKLPLVKQALTALVGQLRPKDKVAIVVYAGAAGLVLPSTSGDEKMKILDALNRLEAGGSTAGGAGIELAYKVAVENFIEKGNNRVIIATDGDFNVGASSDGEMQRLIEAKRETGIFLSVLGLGMGNYKDNKLETLADKGNGNYAYIDNFEEARRIFVTEFGGTLFTIAKDVKLQVEFNPVMVQSYRLIGYENRVLQDEDFNNDKKDAGDMGAGHTVTALYEIVPAGGRVAPNEIDPLKYQEYIPTKARDARNEVLTVKVRYKQPEGRKSILLSKVLTSNMQRIDAAPADFRMAAAVAEFGMLLRNSEFKGKSSYEHVLQLATTAKGEDTEGYRAEFIQLVKKAALLKPTVAMAD
ncbi:von Willebrand factor type A domain-containing protein [Chitinophaga horti]|uniref:von Willebrand factor type A domain-containing protein n=1 Tax=Chitinophaga horti TaxID=2920382 RepID=A0ABY6J1Q2_9BACT|nr:von Willebrand factor type A domain-containing protein [Chitinophaga horti]UYQ92276.1 von Willebrand factor type A domain-containing protein [Chitinophaga horti]